MLQSRELYTLQFTTTASDEFIKDTIRINRLQDKLRLVYSQPDGSKEIRVLVEEEASLEDVLEEMPNITNFLANNFDTGIVALYRYMIS